jgi:hypothetical protein
MMTFLLCILFAALHGALIAAISIVLIVAGFIRELWCALIVFLSIFSQRITCKYDLHDADDGIDTDPKQPTHFYPYTCRHCKKEFYV